MNIIRLVIASVSLVCMRQLVHQTHRDLTATATTGAGQMMSEERKYGEKAADEVTGHFSIAAQKISGGSQKVFLISVTDPKRPVS